VGFLTGVTEIFHIQALHHCMQQIMHRRHGHQLSRAQEEAAEEAEELE
jgi:hypothetical protein